jgi:hypothetical protein
MTIREEAIQPMTDQPEGWIQVRVWVGWTESELPALSPVFQELRVRKPKGACLSLLQTSPAATEPSASLRGLAGVQRLPGPPAPASATVA